MDVRVGRTDPEPPAALPVLASDRVLRVTRGGRLRPWLGPALRGLAGTFLKAHACRQPAAEWNTRWRYCWAAPSCAGCAYGETIEGEPPGLAAGPRPVVVAADYPAPDAARPGDEFRVRAVVVGPAAVGHAAAFWDALRRGGADPAAGLGSDRVLFDVPSAGVDQSAVVELPPDPAAVAGVAGRVRVTLTGPLILKMRAGGDRHLVRRPTLADLLRPWESLAELFRYAGGGLPAGAVGRVLAAAAGVPTVRSAFESVFQVKSSGRTGERGEVGGVVGWAEYGPVPAGLVPWLVWAGRLHVGGHRVAGAGGWGVERLTIPGTCDEPVRQLQPVEPRVRRAPEVRPGAGRLPRLARHGRPPRRPVVVGRHPGRDRGGRPGAYCCCPPRRRRRSRCGGEVVHARAAGGSVPAGAGRRPARPAAGRVAERSTRSTPPGRVPGRAGQGAPTSTRRGRYRIVPEPARRRRGDGRAAAPTSSAGRG